MSEKHICRVCDRAASEIFLRRDNVPVHQNLVFRSERAACDVQHGDLLLAVCGNCGFVSNEAFDHNLISYGAGYDNDQTWSSTFESHIREIANRVMARHKLKNAKVIEVGCGNGRFLRELLRDGALGNAGWGFDPCYQGPAVDLN